MIDLDAIKAAGLNSRENSERLLVEHRARQDAANCYDCQMATKGPHWPVFAMGCWGCVARGLALPPCGPGGG